MIKKEHITSIIVAILSIAFITISVLLYFNKNSRWLVARKIALGAIILTLTAVTLSCRTHRRTCYVASIEYLDPIDTTQTK